MCGIDNYLFLYKKNQNQKKNDQARFHRVREIKRKRWFYIIRLFEIWTIKKVNKWWKLTVNINRMLDHTLKILCELFLSFTKLYENESKKSLRSTQCKRKRKDFLKSATTTLQVLFLNYWTLEPSILLNREMLSNG